MQKSITINKIKPYIKKISQDFDIYFPVKIESYIKLTNDIKLIDNLFFGITNMPPKQFFLPAFEEMFYKNNITPEINPKNKKILFGIHPMDVKALSILNKIFLLHNDFYFHRLKNKFYIVSVGNFEYKDNFNCDIFLEANGDIYDVYLKNPKLKKLLNYRNIFSNHSFEKERSIEQTDPLFKDIIKLSMAVESSYDSKIWNDIAKICTGCGICSFVCPLCYCHQYEDTFALNKKINTKIRRWSSCMHKDFFEINGKNFKPKLRDRIYNWYHHKFVRFPRETGHIGCIDCNRCINSCPAKINFKHILKTILNDYEKSLQTKRSKN